MAVSTRTRPLDMAVLLRGEEAGPSMGSGLLLESDIGGTSFLLLETGEYLLLEA